MAYAPATSEIYGDVLHECVACGSQKISYWRTKNFQYTDGADNKEFHIYRCVDCGTGFLNQPPHVQWLQAIYQYSGQALTQPVTIEDVLAREAEFPNCTVDAERMAKNADQYNYSDNRRALDIGSGFGFYTRALKKAGYQTVSINPGEYENEVFRKLNSDEPVPVMFEEFEPDEPFGVVLMSQVLEHLLEPNRSIRKVSDLLTTGGVLACAVPNYDSFLVKLLGTKDNACLWVPEHVNYFTEQGLTALLEQNGFHVVKVEQITRVPFNALSRRLGLSGRPAAAADALVRFVQIPFAGLMNFFGLGIYINLYAVKK
ncbi:bifunctional 2-polyprenyl-6-hydroxyphenol methylase/3-demethylubiquinol 3-O-methyltransferase UbiG [Methylobacter sp. BlB1]|uniref:class I SAM-dependent methyltransferase n=1 Tax=Methylobacter sp. BlB1 TaxID=2785914 RepID=UPI0018940AC0|nr:class I SAM-dependent methyltransferase [Methylobacter sp. BlB1]MBF6649098.1 class I SAM-dependent methyltransferase [Methylobacter sp. BlB1]